MTNADSLEFLVNKGLGRTGLNSPRQFTATAANSRWFTKTSRCLKGRARFSVRGKVARSIPIGSIGPETRGLCRI